MQQQQHTKQQSIRTANWSQSSNVFYFAS